MSSQQFRRRGQGASRHEIGWRRGSLLLLASVLVAASCSAREPARAPERAVGAGPYDLVITNGIIVDGSGAPRFVGDLAIRGDRIAAVEKEGGLADAPAH